MTYTNRLVWRSRPAGAVMIFTRPAVAVMIFTRPAGAVMIFTRSRNAATGDNSMYCMIPDPIDTNFPEIGPFGFNFSVWTKMRPFGSLLMVC